MILRPVFTLFSATCIRSVKYRMIHPMAKRTKRKISLGCLFWIVFILLIAVLFFLNKDTISFVLEKTNARSIFSNNKVEKTQESTQTLPEIQSKEDSAGGAPVTGDGSKEPEQDAKTEPAKLQQNAKQQSADKQPAAPVKPEPANPRNSEQIKKTSPENQTQSASQQSTAQTTAPNAATSKPADERTAQRSTAAVQQQPSVSSSAPSSAAAVPVKPAADKDQSVSVRKAVIYWIRVDADGKLLPKSAVRLMPKSDAPMSDALEALFAAPTVEELKQGVRTLVPPGTKLRSAWVKDGVAFINVSEEFQFNQYGIDGALAQLSQVVFTATEFSTVKSVQFLIEGQKKDYLGAEGVWIGSPLSRTSF